MYDELMKATLMDEDDAVNGKERIERWLNRVPESTDWSRDWDTAMEGVA